MQKTIYEFVKDYNFNTENIANAIANRLAQKYRRDFEVIKIGERFGTELTNTITAFCRVKDFEDFVFRVKFDMVAGRIIEDNFYIRCTCFFVEKEINQDLIDINSLARVEIFTKNQLDTVYREQELLNKFGDEFFVATIILEKGKDVNYLSFLSKLENAYKGIKIKIMAYEMTPETFSKFFEKSQTIDYFSMSYIETFPIESKRVFKIDNGKIVTY